MTPEGAVKRDIRKWLLAHGLMSAGAQIVPPANNGWFFAPQNNGLGVSGIPDVVGCIGPNARFFAIEAKAKGGKPTANQLMRHAEIRAVNGIVILAYSVADLEPLKEYL